MSGPATVQRDPQDSDENGNTRNLNDIVSRHTGKSQEQSFPAHDSYFLGKSTFQSGQVQDLVAHVRGQNSMDSMTDQVPQSREDQSMNQPDPYGGGPTPDPSLIWNGTGLAPSSKVTFNMAINGGGGDPDPNPDGNFDDEMERLLFQLMKCKPHNSIPLAFKANRIWTLLDFHKTHPMEIIVKNQE